MRFSTFHNAQLIGERDETSTINWAVEDAVLAEQLNFEYCWVAEHHFSRYGLLGSPTIAMAVIAGRTSRIKIGSAVAVVPLHHPLRLAEEFALVDVLSGGRLVAGVGPGFSPLEFEGFEISTDERRDRFHEGIEIIRRAWTEDTVDFDGAFYKINGMQSFPKPIQRPCPPIVHASTKPESQAYAARLGRPILLGRLGDETAHEDLLHYASVRREAGHTEADITRSLELCGVLRHVYISNDREEAWRTATEAAGRYLPHAARLGLPSRLTADPQVQETPEDLLERGAIVGTPDDVIDQLGYLHSLGVRHLMCWFDWGGIEHERVVEAMRIFASDVMPLFAPAAPPAFAS